jgi:class 3 adenylate cyclase
VLVLARPNPSRRRDTTIDTVIERFGGCPLPAQAPGRVLATFDGPARAIRCALSVVAELGTEDRNVSGAVHSGECEFQPHGLRGVAIDVAKELAASTPPGQVLVTQTVRDLVVGSTIQLEPRGRRSFQGIPGDWDILAVTSVDR